jgi:HK97 family phage major capsid protein
LADPTITWKAEAVEITPTDPTFVPSVFQTKTLSCIVCASLQLIQDSPIIENMLEDMFINAFREEIERAILMGAGGDEPTGVYYTPGLATTYCELGAALDSYLDMIAIQAHLENENAVNQAFITNPFVYADLQSLRDSTDDQMIVPPPGLAPIYTTSAVPFNLTYGGHTPCSAILCGQWDQVYLGLRLSPRVVVLKERYMEFLKYGFVAMARADVKIVHPGAMARIVCIERAAGAKT